MKRWPLFALAGGSLSLIAARIIWPSLRFDNTSLILFGVAGIALLVAFLPLKRIKWGEFEAELDRAVDDLERKVTASEKSPAPHHLSKIDAPVLNPHSTQDVFFNEYMALFTSPSSNVEKIIAASILLEKMIDSFVTSMEPEIKVRGRGPRIAIDQLAETNLITPQERDAFRNLWAVRNRIVHEGLQPTDEQTARLLDLVWRLWRTLA
jgi:uncharacterized protein YutE (UPF0331/DUF86 family)